MPPAQIDHLVLLLSYRDLVLPPPWLATHFTIAPGGRHTDGRTENKLIIFQDGTYIELLAFIEDNPSLRYGHFWGDKPPGFIDFALTNHPSPSAGGHEYAGLRGRINRRSGRLGIDYALPSEGGRKRPDGKEIKWKTTAPVSTLPGSSASSRRGEIPFWCHDITPRALRIDPTNKAHTTHPCGAIGLAQITVLVPRERVGRYVDLYASIMDTQPVHVFDTTRLPLDSPVAVPGLPKPWVFVEEPTIQSEVKRVRERGPGVVEIAVRVGTAAGGVGLARGPVCENGVWIHFLK